MKRLLCIFTTICLIISMAAGFSGCGEIKDDGIPFFSADKSNFLLIRSEKADSATIEAAKYFRQAIIDTHNITMEYKTDSVAVNKDKYEVNIGVTNRPKAKKIYDEILSANKNNAKDFSIVKDGKIIYIVGSTDYALKDAVVYFLSHYCAYKTSTVPTTLEYKFHFDISKSNLSLAGEKDISKFKVVIPKYNMSYVVGREVDTLLQQIVEATGILVEKVTDNTKESECEIVIGETKRGNAPLPSNTDEFIIKAKGKKLYVNGATDLCTAIAIKDLGKMITEEKAIDSNFNYTGSYSYSKKSYDDPLYSLTWSDEFDTLDTNIWTIEKGVVNNKKINGKDIAFSGDEKNVKVEDGKLIMRADYNDKAYEGAEIRTSKSVWYKYGLAEISFKYNNTDGLVSAFWTLGLHGASEVSGEIDVFESYALRNKLRCTSLAHAEEYSHFSSDIEYGSLQPSEKEVKDMNSDFYKKVFHELPDGDTFDDDWHTIGAEWDESSIRWVLDGQVILEIDTTANERARLAFNDNMQFILTQYSANNVFPKIQKDVSENTDWKNNHFTVDYLRLYQLPGQQLSKYY